MRPFSIETPMQYIFVHRVVQAFICPIVGLPRGFEQDYNRWLDERSQRLFIDDFNREVINIRMYKKILFLNIYQGGREKFLTRNINRKKT